MHDAPSVSFPVGPCVWCKPFQQALWALAFIAASGVVWWAQRPWSWALALWVGWALGAYCLHRQRPVQGCLHWRGEAPLGQRGWWWSAHADDWGQPLRELHVVLDLQSRMAMVLRPLQGRRFTVWVESPQAPQAWLALRQALWHHAHEAPPQEHS